MLEYSPIGLWQFEVARTFFNIEIISAAFLQGMEGGNYFALQKRNWETAHVIKCIHLK